MTLRELGRERRLGMRVRHCRDGEFGRLTGVMHTRRDPENPIHVVDTERGRRFWFENGIERLGEIEPFPKGERGR